jgi:hypothetical protein
MPKSFWTEIAVSVVAVSGAAIAFYLNVEYLPSILLIVAALMVTGIFAEIEDHLIAAIEHPETPAIKKYLLILTRVARTVLLLFIAITAVVLIL